MSETLPSRMTVPLPLCAGLAGSIRVSLACLTKGC